MKQLGRVFLVLIVALWLAPSASFAAQERDWTKIKRGDLPAKVLSIIYPDGVIIHGKARALAGRQVGFKPGVLPTAEMTCLPSGQCPNIQVTGLECAKPGATAPCRLILAPGAGGSSCWVVEAGQRASIPCPTKLRLP